MKKHPILKYILILIVSGACGALVSYLIASREEQVVVSTSCSGSLSPRCT